MAFDCSLVPPKVRFRVVRNFGPLLEQRLMIIIGKQSCVISSMILLVFANMCQSLQVAVLTNTFDEEIAQISGTQLIPPMAVDHTNDLTSPLTFGT